MNFDWHNAAAFGALLLSAAALALSRATKVRVKQEIAKIERALCDDARIYEKAKDAIIRAERPGRAVMLFGCEQMPPPLDLGSIGDYAFCTVYPAGRFIYGPKKFHGWGQPTELDGLCWRDIRKESK